MEKRYLFVCVTQLQLISSLNIIDSLDDSDCIFDLVLIEDGRYDVFALKDRLKYLDIFERINILKNTETYKVKNFIRGKTSSLDFLLYHSKIFRSFLLKKNLNLSLESYDHIFLCSDGKWAQLILSMRKDSAIVHIIDEGVGSYTSVKLIGNEFDYIHLYEPELFSIDSLSSNKIKKIKKITSDRKKLLDWLNFLFKIFELNNKESQNAVVYFLDQPLESTSDALNPIVQFKIQVISNLIKKKDKKSIIFRRHPKSLQGTIKTVLNLFDENVLVERAIVPFEFELYKKCNQSIEIHTISSSAAIYWLFMFSALELKIHVYIYYLAYEDRVEERYLANKKQLDNFFKKVCSRYNENITLVECV